MPDPSAQLPAAYLSQFAEPPGYLDFAATGPVSTRVVEAVTAAASEAHTGGLAHLDTVVGHLACARELAGGLLGVPAEQVALAPSTSAGLFAVAFGLPGGNVVVPAAEFPANRYPWERAAGRGDLQVRLVDAPGGRLEPADVAACVDAGTVAVALSAVDYRTGFRPSLEDMREAAGDALLVVDAIQALGAVPLSLAPADVVVAGGQKWLRAGWGGAVLACSQRALDRLAPVLSGWSGVEDAMDFSQPIPGRPAPGAQRFCLSFLDPFTAAALVAALELIDLAGIDRISAVIAHRVAELEAVVRSAGGQVLAPWRNDRERAGLFAFEPPAVDPAELAIALADLGIHCSLRMGRIRLSPHATTSAEAPALLAEALARSGCR